VRLSVRGSRDDIEDKGIEARLAEMPSHGMVASAERPVDSTDDAAALDIRRWGIN
jgi:hypothetical protein